MKNLTVIAAFIILALMTAYILILHPYKGEFKESDLFDEILQRGYIKVGINTDSKPYGFYDDNKNLVGFDVDFAHNIALYLLNNPNRLEFIPVTPSNRLIKASTGEVDIVISTVTITPQRQEVVKFSIPYDYAEQALLVRRNSAIKSMADLSGLNVGVVFGTTAEKNLKNMVPTANIRGYRTYKDAYLGLKDGQIDALTSDNTILKRFTIDDKTVKLYSIGHSNEPYGIAFKKGHSTKKLKERIDYAIKDMKRKNVLTRMKNKWNL